MKQLALRADGNLRTGAGHFSRSLSLARAAKRSGIESVMYCLDTDRSWIERAEGSGIKVVELESNSAELFGQKVENAEWITVDGYEFDGNWFNQLAGSRSRILAFDDCGDRCLGSVDAILNGNPFAAESMYAEQSAALQLLGPAYAPLAPAFSSATARDNRHHNCVVLVTFGGSSLGLRASAVAFDGLCEVSSHLQVVYVGALTDENQSAFDRLKSNGAITVVHHLWSEQMAELMVQADFALTGSGSTTLELACLGTPAAVVVLAENQRVLGATMHDRGAVINQGDLDALTPQAVTSAVTELLIPERRQSMAEAGRKLVDGFGCDRALMAMFDLPLRLRQAVWQDCERLYQWAVDPEARAASLNRDTIPFSTHENWFRERLDDADTRIYMAIDSKEDVVGVARFERESGTAPYRLSFTVAPEYRGRSLGGSLVRLAIDRLVFDDSSATTVKAEARTENVASQRIMERVGFQRVNPSTKGGCICYRIELN